MILTPLAINMLLHLYYDPNPIPNQECYAQQSILRDFIDEGLTCRNKDDELVLTARDFAHVFQLTNLPLPVQAWVGANGEIIFGDFPTAP